MLVDRALALIGDPLALVGSLLARVGHLISLGCATLSLVKLAALLLQAGGLRTGALGSFTNLLRDPALLGGLIGLSGLLAPVSVLQSQTSATFVRLGRLLEDGEQAPWVDRWTSRNG